MGVIGTVESVGDSGVRVNFKNQEVKLHLNPDCFDKLNKFSVNQIVRIRSDRQTIREIESDFGISYRDLDNNKVNYINASIIFISRVPNMFFLNSLKEQLVVY